MTTFDIGLIVYAVKQITVIPFQWASFLRSTQRSKLAYFSDFENGSAMQQRGTDGIAQPERSQPPPEEQTPSQSLSRLVTETLLDVLGADVGLDTPLLAAGLDSLSGPHTLASSSYALFSSTHTARHS